MDHNRVVPLTSGALYVRSQRVVRPAAGPATRWPCSPGTPDGPFRSANAIVLQSYAKRPIECVQKPN
jgi:hypothetical protein